MCQRKFGASDALKQSIVLTDKVDIRDVWEVSLDQGTTFQNMLQHPLLKSNLTDVDDRRYDLTDATAAALNNDEQNSGDTVSWGHLFDLNEVEEEEEQQTPVLEEDVDGKLF